MSNRIRRNCSGTCFEVTTRTINQLFRLVPTPERVEAILFWLAWAQSQCVGIELFAVVSMSNHLHIVLRDNLCELPAFMRVFVGNLARALNRIDKVLGSVFERKYGALEILDPAAVVDRIAYAVSNPVQANLVKRHQDWPGVCLWAHDGRRSYRVSRIRVGAFLRAQFVAKLMRRAPVDREDFREWRTLVISPFNGASKTEVAGAIEEYVASAQETHGAQRAFGAARVLQQEPFSRPDEPKMTRLPLCHATFPEAWLEFKDAWQHYTRTYRLASAAYRTGELDVHFPAGSFPPWRPVTPAQ